ncbi:MAG: sensor histidine kinase [Eubacteriales bacterium]|nr:sensor histidine kinase [Eubacteriales bacterium]
MIILLVFICLCLTAYFFIARKATKISDTIQDTLNSYSPEDIFQEDLSVNPEVDLLFSTLNERFNKTKYLDLSQKQAQYLALQNQINPHFLYNTLECIRSEAVCEGIESVAIMTETLSTFFRYTISNIDKLVTIEDELNNIDNYYRIQHYRFGDKLSLTVSYDTDCEINIPGLFMPKLILQPIVENAIYHGLEPKVGKGSLQIKINCNTDYLIINIIDDGLGMEKEALDRLNRRLLKNILYNNDDHSSSKGGIAVTNVNNRIKLLFGERYGIHIHSTKNVGTDVEITLPVILKGNS